MFLNIRYKDILNSNTFVIKYIDKSIDKIFKKLFLKSITCTNKIIFKLFKSNYLEL